MTKKTGWLAGLAIGCVLSTPALADEYRGFYMTAWGGGGEIDFLSKGDLDDIITTNLATEVANVPILGRTNLAINSIDGSELDDSLSVWGAQVGFRFNKFVAVEFGYVNLGELLYTLDGQLSGQYSFVQPCSTTGCTTTTIVDAQIAGGFERGIQLTSSGITGSVLGMFPIGPRFDLHVRGGLYMADTRVTDRLRFVGNGGEGTAFNLLHRRVDASQTELFGGIGGAWNINEGFALRVEYQKYLDVGDDEKTGEGDVDVINVAVMFK